MDKHVSFFIFICYFAGLSVFIYFITKKKKPLSENLNTWIYALALCSSFFTGWTLFGMPSSFYRENFLFIGYFLGLILLSFLFPYILEKIYRQLEKHQANDLISYILIRYDKDRALKILLIIVILLIIIPFISINLRSLHILLSSIDKEHHMLLNIMEAAVIVFFVLKIREWKGITVVALQGLLMLFTLIFFVIFIGFILYKNPTEIFKAVSDSDFKSHLTIGSEQWILNWWNINIVIGAFGFLFMPRQFSIISQGMNLNPRTKIFKTSILLIVFSLVVILFVALAGGSAMAVKADNKGADFFMSGLLDQNPLLYFVFHYDNFFVYCIYLLAGFAFIISTLNQELVALSDLLKKHMNVKFTVSIIAIMLSSMTLTHFFNKVYLDAIGLLVLIGIFQLAIPIAGGVIWKKANSRGAFAGLIAGMVMWVWTGWLNMLSDPKSFTDGVALIPKEFFGTGFFSPGHFLNLEFHDYLLASFFYCFIFNLLFFVKGSLFLVDRKKLEILAPEHDPSMARFDRIFQLFHYDMNLISLFAILYKNRELKFSIGEIKDYLKIDDVENKLIYLEKHHLILKKTDRMGVFYTIQPEADQHYDFENFFRSFFDIKYHLDKMMEYIRESKEKIDSKLTQIDILYIVYLKIASIKDKKNFFSKLTKVILFYYPDILKIEHIRDTKVQELYTNPDELPKDHQQYEIDLGTQVLRFVFEKNFDSNNLLILEPVIILAYEVALYIEKLKNYAKKLKQTDNIRNHFISNISHELRTPMVPIKGYLLLLVKHKEIEKHPDIVEILKTMESSYKRLEMLIENLIDFKEVSFDLFNIRKINLMELVFTLLMEIKPKLESKSLMLQYFEEDFKNLEIQGDAEKLKLALLQVIDNAIKFNRMNGKIVLRAKETGGKICITVKDNGIGIKEESLHNVFDPFYQGDIGATRLYEGAGIGLSIAKKIVSLHQGQIKIKSIEGKGTTVKIILPRNHRQ